MPTMTRKIRLMIILVSLIGLSACSIRNDFVVVNETNQPIEVRYQVAPAVASFQPPANQETTNQPYFLVMARTRDILIC
jgi:hypothetical protein